MIDHRVIEYITQAPPNWVDTAGAPDAPRRSERIVRFQESHGKQLLKFLKLPFMNFFWLERTFSALILSENLLDPACGLHRLTQDKLIKPLTRAG
jgi:hypothetical protein